MSGGKSELSESFDILLDPDAWADLFGAAAEDLADDLPAGEKTLLTVASTLEEQGVVRDGTALALFEHFATSGGEEA